MSDRVQAIRYGMFIMPFHDPAKPLAQCYDEDLELIVRAEEMGLLSNSTMWKRSKTRPPRVFTCEPTI